MRLIITGDDRDLLNRAFDGLEDKAREEFVLLREPVGISEEEFAALVRYLRFRLETIGLVSLTLRAVAEVARERGFEDVPALSIPDEIDQRLVKGHGFDAFGSLRDRADAIAEVRIDAVWPKKQELLDEAIRADGGMSPDTLRRAKEKKAEQGLADPLRDLGDEMWGAFYNLEKWFLDRLGNLEPVS
jgi:hypothetical protein